MNLLATRGGRRVLFALLYLAEGAPIGYVWWYLPTRLRLEGLAVERITALTALAVLPWSLKFLWAPLVDVLRGPRWTLRAWILAAQAGMAATLAATLWVDPVAHTAMLGALLVAHAIAAATQDVAIDTLAIASTAPAERGAVNGWMQAGMLAGRSVFGGLALVAAERVGAPAVGLALVATLVATGALVLLARSPDPPPPRGGRGLGAALAEAVRLPGTLHALGFALVAGAGFEAVGAVAGPFLVDLGHDGAAVGRFLALPAVAAMLAGALAGGHLADRLGRVRAAASFLVLVAGAVGATAWAAASDAGAVLPALTAVYVALGLFTAASYALFMDATHPRLGATQFSAFMAATNACEAWSAFAVGRLSSRAGYPAAFAALGAVSLLGLPLLLGLARARRRARGGGTAGDVGATPGGGTALPPGGSSPGAPPASPAAG